MSRVWSMFLESQTSVSSGLCLACSWRLALSLWKQLRAFYSEGEQHEEEEGRLKKVVFLANLRRSDERCRDENATNVNHLQAAPETRPEDYLTTHDSRMFVDEL